MRHLFTVDTFATAVKRDEERLENAHEEEETGGGDSKFNVQRSRFNTQ